MNTILYIYFKKRKKPLLTVVSPRYQKNEDSIQSILWIIKKKMRCLCLFGLLPYIHLYFEKQNIIPFIIFINGILFHSNETNIYLKIYDIIINSIIILHFSYHYFPQIRSHVCFAILIFFLNFYCFSIKNYYNRIHADAIHMIGVQYVLSRGLKKVLW